MLTLWQYLLGYLFAGAFRYWSYVKTYLAIFGQQQSQFHSNYQNHCCDGSGNDHINCFDVLFSYFLLTSPIFSSILFYSRDVSITFLLVLSVLLLQTICIIFIAIIS